MTETLDREAPAANKRRPRGSPPGTPPGTPRAEWAPAAASDAPPAAAGAQRPDTAPKRSHRRKGSDVKVTPSQTKEALTVAVVGVDTLLALVNGATHSHFWEEEDRLENAETAAIVGAVYRELETYPKAMAFFQRMVVGSVHAQLAAVLMAVAIPRLARRGLVPVQLVLMAAAVLSTYSGNTSTLTPTSTEAPNVPTPSDFPGFDFGAAPAPVGTGAAPFGSGAGGTGEEHTNGRVAPGPITYSGVSQ